MEVDYIERKDKIVDRVSVGLVSTDLHLGEKGLLCPRKALSRMIHDLTLLGIVCSSLPEYLQAIKGYDPGNKAISALIKDSVALPSH